MGVWLAQIRLSRSHRITVMRDMCFDCGSNLLIRKRPGDDGNIRCRRCAGNRRKTRYKKTDKGKASAKKFYETYGYVHQNNGSRNRRVFERYPCCGFCSTKSDLSVDHMHPQSKGGSDDQSNLWTLCVSCNSFKHDKLVTPGLGVLIGVSY